MDAWTLVAYASLSDTSSKYETRFSFANSPPPPLEGKANRIETCYGTRDECARPLMVGPDGNVLPGGNPLPATCPSAFAHAGILVRLQALLDRSRWFTRVLPPGGTPRYMCSSFRGLPDGVEPPPVTRWRWDVKDETVWVKCPAGCCQVEPR